MPRYSFRPARTITTVPAAASASVHPTNTTGVDALMVESAIAQQAARRAAAIEALRTKAIEENATQALSPSGVFGIDVAPAEELKTSQISPYMVGAAKSPSAPKQLDSSTGKFVHCTAQESYDAVLAR